MHPSDQKFFVIWIILMFVVVPLACTLLGVILK